MMTPPVKRARTAEASINLHGGPSLPAEMVSQYRSGRFCDVTIAVEGEEVPAQGAVLAGGTEYFRGLLIGAGSQMSGSSTLTLEEMSASTVRLVLDWLYTGACAVEPQELLDLLAAAGRLGIDSLQEAATWSILGHLLTEDTCLELLTAARQLSVPKLEEGVVQYALQHFPAVTTSGAVGSLSPELLSRLLESDQLTCSREEQVLDALLRWARATAPAPELLADLLQHVRFDLFANSDSAAKAAAEALFASQPCLAVIASKLGAQVDVNAARSRPRRAAVDPNEGALTGLTGAQKLEKEEAHLQIMKRIVQIHRPTAEYALKVQQRGLSHSIVGPLFMYVHLQEPFAAAFSGCRGFLWSGTPVDMLAKTFLRLSSSTPPVLSPSSLNVFTPETEFVAADVFKHRPPSRELARFLGQSDGAQLAWLDEVLTIDESELQIMLDDDASLVERVKNKTLALLRDSLRCTGTLVCTATLPPATISALHAYVLRHEALSGCTASRFAAIITPGFTTKYIAQKASR
eukprot:Transcript_6691.p1 GENE.Transcript_6691~~Transcript_6691.p1  ORF type:complete len:538 (-),score=113.20 Transcript_6691:262-1818(-)